MVNIYWTNPEQNMLLGFETQDVGVRNMETGVMQYGSMFSIGLGICRFDLIFNLEDEEDEI